jgi:hypothetical protein
MRALFLFVLKFQSEGGAALVSLKLLRKALECARTVDLTDNSEGTLVPAADFESILSCVFSTLAICSARYGTHVETRSEDRV